MEAGPVPEGSLSARRRPGPPHVPQPLLVITREAASSLSLFQTRKWAWTRSVGCRGHTASGRARIQIVSSKAKFLTSH